MLLRAGFSNTNKEVDIVTSVIFRQRKTADDPKPSARKKLKITKNKSERAATETTAQE